MTEAQIRALNDAELVLVGAWVEDEQKVRKERHKRETIAKIKEMAGEIGISVSIAGTRGRPKAAAKSPVVRVS